MGELFCSYPQNWGIKGDLTSVGFLQTGVGEDLLGQGGKVDKVGKPYQSCSVEYMTKIAKKTNFPV
jgi:hypothetical protein